VRVSAGARGLVVRVSRGTARPMVARASAVRVLLMRTERRDAKAVRDTIQENEHA
jgi:hypothetical protein